MKRFLLSIIVVCTFSLICLSENANDSNERKVKAYPNPIDRSATLTVELPDGDDEITVLVVNPVGKIIRTHKTFEKKLEFPAPEISGIYLLRIVEKQKIIAFEKIIVKE